MHFPTWAGPGNLITSRRSNKSDRSKPRRNDWMNNLDNSCNVCRPIHSSTDRDKVFILSIWSLAGPATRSKGYAIPPHGVPAIESHAQLFPSIITASMAMSSQSDCCWSSSFSSRVQWSNTEQCSDQLAGLELGMYSHTCLEKEKFPWSLRRK
jgi:hypothetical protein